MITNYQKQKGIVLSLLVLMVVLSIGYILYVTAGLLVVTANAQVIDKPEVVYLEREVALTPLEDPKIVKDLTPPSLLEPKEEPVNQEDLRVLAQIINAEAGNQPYEGKLAVGNVILNRVESPKFPDTVEEVVYQKGQFSPVSNGDINKKPNEDSIKAAKEVLKGRTVVAENVLFFYNPEISTSGWIFTRQVVETIGEHVFAV